MGRLRRDAEGETGLGVERVRRKVWEGDTCRDEKDFTKRRAEGNPSAKVSSQNTHHPSHSPARQEGREGVHEEEGPSQDPSLCTLPP